jgi:hypothetical protein
MTDESERAYIEGSRVAWRKMLRQALMELGRDSEEWNQKRWLLEREEAISMLRRICERLGDNDWPDDLNLADIIDKHLNRHIPD